MATAISRLLVAGFLHETNTFANGRVDWAAFENDGGFQAMLQGQALLSLQHIDVPLGGFLEAM